MRGIKDSFTYGCKVTGVTVHFVDDKMDHGSIIMQEAVRIGDKDTVESLNEKIYKVEHRIYPRAIQLYVEKRLNVKGRRVSISERLAGG